MRARALVRLHDILSEIGSIRRATARCDFETFDRDWLVLRATQHGLLIISDAVRHLPHEMKGRRPDIPWARIATLGNLLRHEYAAIDNRGLWDLVENHLGPLEGAVRELLERNRE